MPIITWDENLPSDASRVGIGDRDIRQHLQSIATGLGLWLEWPGNGLGSSLSAGELRLGASRLFHAAASASSNSAGGTLDGRGFFTSDTSRHYVYTSDGTYCVGSQRLIERTGTGVGQVPIVISGQTTTSGATSAALIAIQYNRDGVGADAVTFSASPVVQMSSDRTDWLGPAFNVATVHEVTSRISYLGSNTTQVLTINFSAYGFISDSSST